MAYSHEAEIDARYAAHPTFSADVAMLLRAMPAMLGYLLSGGRDNDPAVISDEIRILGIRIDNTTMRDAIDRILRATKEDQSRQVCFVNPQCANVACRDQDYRAVLDKADMVFADGIGMKIAGNILKRPIRENVNGTDMFPQLSEAMEGSAKGLYLLGARPDVPEAVRDWLARNHPGVTVIGSHHGYFGDEGEADMIRTIRESGADILLVAMGVPSQDLWISRHLAELGVKVAIGVGGLFDFYSGRIPRAPLWMREIGMEWFYRFWQEPGRMWKRYFVGNVVFLYRVLRERCGRQHSR